MASQIFLSLALLAAICCSGINAYGQPVSVEQVPSITQIEVRVGSLWIQQCAGSVLTSVHVLGPASCFTGILYLRENRRIRAGSNTRGDGGAIAEVGIATTHPNFGTRGSDSDIAVIRLANAFPLGGDIQQGQILAQGAALPSGLPVQAFGWGKTIQGGEISDGRLHSDLLHIYASCAGSTENQICVGTASGGRDFDARDVGAPVVYDKIIIGQLTEGNANDGNRFPVIATSIASFTNWIVANAV